MVTKPGAGAGEGAEIETTLLACLEQSGLQRVKPGREGCPQSRVPGFLCLKCLSARGPGQEQEDPRVGRAEEGVLPSSRCPVQEDLESRGGQREERRNF